ncbi:DUF4910 domain-containing protein [Hydrogenophaga sp.]|uniref:DUF4910 domain-containing protein n=1 Tax=Hydrogenophaga sp. TaxID=1904254 RepID=UPI003F6C6E4C
MTTLGDWVTQLNTDRAGERMHHLIERLYPICRSITGDGVRQTLDIVCEHMPLKRTEVPTGTRIFDWTIPNEWNICSAWIRGPDGAEVVNFVNSNLHVVSYSTPVHTRMTLDALQPHLHSDPEHPDWIPYRTSYYQATWGFCLSHRQRETLAPGTYEVFIDATLQSGSLTYAECVFPGARKEEVLLFAHTCHPSLCNDNLSGIALLSELSRYLAKTSLEFTYRIILAPATIGSLAWLCRNEHRWPLVHSGLIVSVAGDAGAVTYKRSRRHDAAVDKASAYVLASQNNSARVLDFSPWGYDERQFCSPGINLPMGRLTRSPNGTYAQYHTSADNLDLVRPEHLQDSLATLLAILNVVDADRTYLNLFAKGEPQLGRRGLYQMMGGTTQIAECQHALLWVLNYSDGLHSLLDIAQRSKLDFSLLQKAAALAVSAGLLTPTRRAFNGLSHHG